MPNDGKSSKSQEGTPRSRPDITAPPGQSARHQGDLFRQERSDQQEGTPRSRPDITAPPGQSARRQADLFRQERSDQTVKPVERTGQSDVSSSQAERRHHPKDDMLTRELPDQTGERVEQREQNDRQPAARLESSSPAIFRDFPVADVLDFGRIAEEVHTAINESTDLVPLYRALQSLQREPLAVEQLSTTYQEHYHENLDEMVRGKFSGAQLEYVQQLMAAAPSESAYAIKEVPISREDFIEVAERLHKTIEDPYIPSEALYAALTPLQRNSILIEQLGEVYAELYIPERHLNLAIDNSTVLVEHAKATLRSILPYDDPAYIDAKVQLQAQEDRAARIQVERASVRHYAMLDELLQKTSKLESDYTRYLLGEQGMEVKNISEAEATRLHTALSEATFVTMSGKREPVPFHFPISGCIERARFMTQVCTEMGYASEKVWAVSIDSQNGNGLRASTDYAGDFEEDKVTTGFYEVEWWFHVAPVVGNKVFDPGLADGPISLQQWLSKMHEAPEDFTHMTMQEVKEMLNRHRKDFPYARESFPKNLEVVFTSSRDVYFQPKTFMDGQNIRLTDDPPSPFSANANYAKATEIMSVHASLARVHELVAELRCALRTHDVTASTIVNILTDAPYQDVAHLPFLFERWLFYEVTERFSNNDQIREVLEMAIKKRLADEIARKS